MSKKTEIKVTWNNGDIEYMTPNFPEDQIIDLKEKLESGFDGIQFCTRGKIYLNLLQARKIEFCE